VATKLAASLSPEEKKSVTQAPTKDQKAYDLYLQARSYQRRPGWSQANAQAATGLLEQAVLADPNYALGYAALSLARSRNFWFGYNPTFQQANAALEAAQTALRLQPDLPEAHNALGNYDFRIKHAYT